MRRSWPVVGLVALLVGCMPTPMPRTVADLPPQTELELRVAKAGLEAWHAAGLATVPNVCRLEGLRIDRPTTLEEYQALCPADSRGCATFWSLAPLAVMHPAVPREDEEHLALHEWLHIAVRCYERGRWPDIFDAAHADPAVWKDKGASRPDSVEQRAQRALAQ